MKPAPSPTLPSHGVLNRSSIHHAGREKLHVARHVVNTWGHREGADDMRLFLAVEAAIQGDINTAQTEAGPVRVRADNTYDQQLLTLAQALITFHKAPCNERHAAFRTIHPDLKKRFGQLPMSHATPDVRRTFARAGKSFVRGGAGWSARWWFALKTAGFR